MIASPFRRLPLPMLTALCLGSVAVAPGIVRAAETASAKPVLLYCRYFNAEGETRYLPDGNFKEVLSRLRGQ